MPSRITLSLISHTNVGKTTLARTLLRRDIGEVRDQAHVTDQSSAHVLLEAGDAQLLLWDTPGFGDSARLLSRLRRERDPVGWFLHQVWDRFVDRPLWCSQEAARNVRDEADVVLYLVNATEEPEDAGYVPLELELLTWIGRPVLLLLNQVGDDDRDPTPAWRRFVEDWPIVRDVLSLDAFTRSWPQERVLLEHVSALLDGEHRQAMAALTEAWDQRNLAVFHDACRRMAGYLARAACDAEPVEASATSSTLDSVTGLFSDALKLAGPAKRRAMSALNERLDQATVQLMNGLIESHGLIGDSAARIERRVQDFQVKGLGPVSERGSALVGAVVSGAIGGLAADALAGGLTLGGGMIAGGILGALGGSAIARGYRLVSGDRQPTMRWSTDFLDQLTRQVLLRYLAVAHFGRGRGRFKDLEQPAHWSSRVDATLARERTELGGCWQQVESGANERALTDRLTTVIERAARSALERA